MMLYLCAAIEQVQDKVMDLTLEEDDKKEEAAKPSVPQVKAPLSIIISPWFDFILDVKGQLCKLTTYQRDQ